jgi:ABC-2 type transport system permease protein
MVVMLASQINLTFNVPQWLAATINFFSLSFHFDSFTKGLFDSRDFVYFVAGTALLLFINTRVILFRKWN